MSVVSLAIALHNRAHEIWTAGGEDAAKEAALRLREAAGAWDYLSQRELPRWIDPPPERPVEISSEVCKAMSELE